MGAQTRVRRTKGHEKGVGAVRNTVEAAAELGIQYLTLYAFSTENWNRPKYEIDALMTLLVQFDQPGDEDPDGKQHPACGHRRP